MRTIATLPVLVLSACVAPGKSAHEVSVGLAAGTEASSGVDAGPVDEGNGLIGLGSGGMDDTGSLSWSYKLLECATGSYVLVSAYDEVGVSRKNTRRLANYVDKQRKAGAMGSLQAFFDASRRAGIKPFESQVYKGWPDESGCEKYYPKIKRDWPVLTEAEKARLERQKAQLASVVGVTATKP